MSLRCYCGSALTSCISRGHRGQYPYYLCHTRDCVSYGKSIRQALLKLAFGQRLAYVRNEGFRIQNLALPFKPLADLRAANREMVGRVGVEPTTKRLRVSCSTN